MVRSSCRSCLRFFVFYSYGSSVGRSVYWSIDPSVGRWSSRLFSGRSIGRSVDRLIGRSFIGQLELGLVVRPVVDYVEPLMIRGCVFPFCFRGGGGAPYVRRSRVLSGMFLCFCRVMPVYYCTVDDCEGFLCFCACFLFVVVTCFIFDRVRPLKPVSLLFFLAIRLQTQREGNSAHTSTTPDNKQTMSSTVFVRVVVRRCVVGRRRF